MKKHPSPTLFSRFTREETGATMVFFAVILSVVILSVAIAIDMTRLGLARVKLTTAVDAATLAGGAVARRQDIPNVVNNFFEANFPDGYLNSRIDPLIIEVYDRDDNVLNFNNPADIPLIERIDVNATGTIDTAILGFLNTNTDLSTAEIASQASVDLGQTVDLEIVLLMDVSRSMCSTTGTLTNNCGSVAANNRRIEIMKRVASGFVTSVFSTANPAQRTNFSVVPFNYNVKLPGTPTFTSNLPTFEHSASTIQGIADTEFLPFVNDPRYGTEYRNYYDLFSNWANNCASDPDRCVYQYWEEAVTRGIADQTEAWDVRNPLLRTVQPFSSAENVINNYINNLEFVGGTNLEVAITEARNALTPSQRSRFNHTITPAAFTDQGTQKIIIWLTDGVTESCAAYGTLRDANGEVGQPDSCENPNPAIGANARKEANATTICDDLTDNAGSTQGVALFTIPFALGNAPREIEGRNLLQGCASRPDFYFDAPDEDALIEAFDTIRSFLDDLRLIR